MTSLFTMAGQLGMDAILAVPLVDPIPLVTCRGGEMLHV